MSQCVLKSLHVLNKLAKAKPAERKQILESASLQLIKSIVECIENVLNGIVKLKKNCLNKLKRHKNTLLNIRTKGSRLAHKKKIIIQSGGSFLPLLLPPVLSVITDQILKRL